MGWPRLGHTAVLDASVTEVWAVSELLPLLEVFTVGGGQGFDVLNFMP